MYRIILVRVMAGGKRIRMREIGQTENYREAQVMGQTEARNAQEQYGGEFAYEIDRGA